MLSEQEILKMLEDSKALLTGHFKLSSGRHSDQYLQCAQVLQYTDSAEELGQELADRCYKKFGSPIHTVASPAVGGIVIGQEVARGLGARAIFAERDPATGKLAFRRGFKVDPSENILLVEDVITTGGSIQELFELVKAEGGNVVGMAAIAQRGQAKALGAAHETLLKLDVKDYAEAECRLCKDGIPVEKPGSRQAAAV